MSKRSIKEIVSKVMKKLIENADKENSLEQVTSNGIQKVDDAQMDDMMAAMDANLDKQEQPKVGIFWYSPRIKDVFGVVAVDAEKQAKIENRKYVSCTELHKYIWKKKHNYYKYHEGCNLYNGDYKETPRGRVFFEPETGEFDIMVGGWINEYPEAIGKIKDAFDLIDPNLKINIKTGEHWEIGMGYGD